VVDIALRRLDPGLPPPSYAHPGDAGADLFTTVDVTLAPGERAMVPTGIAIALPEGTSRSCTRDPASPPGTACRS
jgi:dUTP pyrophosphatase